MLIGYLLDCDLGQYPCPTGVYIIANTHLSVLMGYLLDCDLGHYSCPSVCVHITHLSVLIGYHSDCDLGQYSCPTGVCIQNSSVCDGYVDCEDYGDELGCSKYDRLQLQPWSALSFLYYFLKTVDTIGNYQRPVFSLGVSQHT